MKLVVSAVLFAATLFPAASANATPEKLEVLDAGTDAIVVARGLELANPKVSVRSNRIEVSLVGNHAAETIDIDDDLVNRLGVRIRSTKERRLTVYLRLPTSKIRRLARRIKVGMHDGALQLVIPRDPNTAPVAGFASLATAPTPAAPATTNAEATTAAPLAPAAANEADKPGPATATVANADASNTTNSVLPPLVMLLGFVLLGGAGLILWRLKGRRSARPSIPGIQIISTKALDAKNRIILVAIGDREVLLATGPNGHAVIGKWRRQAPAPHDSPLPPPPRLDSGRALPVPDKRLEQQLGPQPRTNARRPLARPFADGSQNVDRPDRWKQKSTSPSIRGLLQLREQPVRLNNVSAAPDDDDAASEWDQIVANGTRAGLLG